MRILDRKIFSRFGFRYFSSAYVMVIMFWVCCLVSCDNTVTPVSNNQSQYFSVYGYLDTATDTQFVRIEPFRNTFQNLTSSAKLGANAFITDEKLGKSYVLRDSVIKLNDGTFGHLFYAKFRPNPNTPYTLIVRQDNRETKATTTVSPQPSFTITPPTLEQGTGRYSQQMKVSALPQTPNQINVHYFMATDTTRTPIQFSINYNNYGRYVRPNQTLESPVYLEIDLSNAKDRMLSGKPNTTPVYFYGVSLTFETLDDLWATRNLNPAQNVSNIQNGAGFWGAVARWEFAWKLPPSMLTYTKLHDEQPK